MLPTVVTALVAGSGPKQRPRGRKWAFSRSWTMPGCTRTRSPSMRTMRRRNRGEVEHQSRTERFAGHAAAGAAGVDGDVLFGGVLQAGGHVGGAAAGGPRASGLIS